MILLVLLFNSSILFILHIFIFIRIYSINIIYKLIHINIYFFLLKIIYNNYFNQKFNINYSYLKNKKLLINDSICLNDYIFIDYQFKKIYGMKIDLYFILESNNNIYVKNIECIKSIKINKKYFYKTILYLLFKYSIFFKKIDGLVLNNIKEFLY